MMFSVLLSVVQCGTVRCYFSLPVLCRYSSACFFAVAYLLIESLERYDFYYGDSLRVECPTGSGVMMNLKQVQSVLSNIH